MIFYNPEGCTTSGLGRQGQQVAGGTATISGSAMAEKIWSGLKSFGWSDQAVAAAMGNMQLESALNPAKHQGTESGWSTVAGYNGGTGHAVGLIQWDTRRDAMYDYVVSHDSSMAQYLDDPWTYSYPPFSGCDGDCFIGKAGEAAADSLVALELDYLKYEVDNNTSMQRFLNETDVQEAASLFDDYVEISSTRRNGGSGEQSGRRANAQAFYDLYSGQTTFSGGSGTATSSSTNGSDVTIIGDSITVRAWDGRTGPLASKLPQADVYAEVGKRTFVSQSAANGGESGESILNSIIANGNLRDTVIIALGSNDPGVFDESNLQGLVDTINNTGEHKIVFVTNYSVASNPEAYDYTSNNNAIRLIKNNNTNVIIADWAATASGRDSELFEGNDWVHPRYGAGTEAFADTIYNAITSGAVEAAVRTYVDQCNPNGSNSNYISTGVTITTVNGTQYAFPLAYATKENYIGNGSGRYFSELSPLKCTSMDRGVCHHDYPAFDLGIVMDLVDGRTRHMSDVGTNYGGGPSTASNVTRDVSDDKFYYSAEAKVVAITSGTIDYARHSYTTSRVPTDWNDKCGSIKLTGDDGHVYYMAHISEASIKVSDGQHVDVGDVLAEVGSPYCAEQTQAHLHIDMDGQGSSSRDSSFDLIPLMNELYEALPADKAELEAREASGSAEGGLSYEDALKFAIAYSNQNTRDRVGSRLAPGGLWELPLNSSVCNGGMGSNCSTFSAFFINGFTNINVGGTPGDGKDVVGRLNTLKGVSDVGNQPKPWAVFSWSGGTWGHTGVVLGYENGEWIVGQASCTRNEYTHSGGNNGLNDGEGAGYIVKSADIIEATHGRGYVSNPEDIRFAYLADRVDINKVMTFLTTGDYPF